MDWAVSAVTGIASLLQKERDRGRIVVEGASGWPALDPVTITGPSIAYVKVTNLTDRPVQVDGVGFLVGEASIPVMGRSTMPMPAYLEPGRSVQAFCELYWLASISLQVDAAYAHVAGVGRRTSKVNPRRLFYPLSRDLGHAA